MLEIPTDPAERYGEILSLSVEAKGIEPLAFLHHARGQARFYWAGPGDEHVIAGFGKALELNAWGPDAMADIGAQAKRLFEHLAAQRVKPKLFGGFAFRPDFVPENAWASFAPAQFVLPHYQLERQDDRAFLSVHAELQGEALYKDELREALVARRALLEAEALPEEASVEVESLDDLTSLEDWRRMLTEAQSYMAKDALEKVVLARTKEAHFAAEPDVLAALVYLNQNYPDCYRFLYEPRPGHVFLGATPELLIQTQGSRAQTGALAASAPRGATPQEDAALAEALANDPKEVLEHELVSGRIVNRLEAFGQVTAETRRILKLSNIQHLYTPIHLDMTAPTGVLPLLEALHPTPALGGEPLELAGQLISELEALPRGWFAAPVGYLDDQLDGAFAVAIRSAVVQESRAWLFAGAGIVPASEPDKEWLETDLKFRPMLRALRLVPRG